MKIDSDDFDDYIVWLYEVYSDELWAAGWMGSPENEPELSESFTSWLKENKRPRLARKDTPYRDSALSTLRRCYEEAIGVKDD